MKITIIDGQGGKLGKTIVEQLKKRHPELELYAIGTNSLATAAMLKAGADYGATGENPCIVNAQDSDIIIGPVGIVIANALLGEAYKILIPMNKCNHYIVGCENVGLSENIRMVCERVEELIR